MASLLAAIFYQGNHDMNHKLYWKRYTPYAGAATYNWKVRNWKIEINWIISCWDFIMPKSERPVYISRLALMFIVLLI